MKNYVPLCTDVCYLLNNKPLFMFTSDKQILKLGSFTLIWIPEEVELKRIDSDICAWTVQMQRIASAQARLGEICTSEVNMLRGHFLQKHICVL